MFTKCYPNAKQNRGFDLMWVRRLKYVSDGNKLSNLIICIGQLSRKKTPTLCELSKNKPAFQVFQYMGGKPDSQDEEIVSAVLLEQPCTSCRCFYLFFPLCIFCHVAYF